MAAQRLYRSREDQILGGVCAGVADYFSVDPTLVRLGFIIAFLAGGVGLLAYIAAWIIVPEEPIGRAEYIGENGERRRDIIISEDGENNERSNYILGIALVGLGGYFLLRNFIDLGAFFWPSILILAGAYLLTRKN